MPSSQQSRLLISSRRVFQKAWPYLRYLFVAGFVVLVLALLIHHAKEIKWREVIDTLKDYSVFTTLAGIVCAMGAYLFYALYDLLGRFYIKSRISKIRMMMIAFVSCAFTLNLGSLVGGVGSRYRLYTQRGVTKMDVTRIIGVAFSTNWLGYTFLAGWVFATGNLVMPAHWPISTLFLRGLGVVFLVLIVGYLLLCHFASTRSWHIRGQQIVLPTVRLALVQLAVASAHWMMMGTVIFTFLRSELSYFEVLGVLLVSAIAGLIAHIPGALGVLEAVFVGLLADQVPTSKILAALFAYRAVYYLMPLAIAVILYLVMEISVRKQSKQNL